MKNLLPLLTAALLVAAVTTPAAAQLTYEFEKTSFSAKVGEEDSYIFGISYNTAIPTSDPYVALINLTGEPSAFSCKQIGFEELNPKWEVVFKPLEMGDYEAQITIRFSYLDPLFGGPGNVDETHSLEGTAIGNGTDPQADPQELIADLIDFYQAALAGETIKGAGPGRSAANRERAVGNMLLSAQQLIADGYYDLAIEQFEDVLKRATGSNHPSNFIAGGEELAEFQDRLLALIEALGG